MMFQDVSNQWHLSCWNMNCFNANSILQVFLMPTHTKRLALGENNNLEGRYANYFKVGHNAFEFVIDFGQYYPESEEAELFTRIITSPAYAKVLLETLMKSIKQYERIYEAIKVDKGNRYGS